MLQARGVIQDSCMAGIQIKIILLLSCFSSKLDTTYERLKSLNIVYCLPVLNIIWRGVFTMNCCIKENKMGFNGNSVSGKNHGIDDNYKAGIH